MNLVYFWLLVACVLILCDLAFATVVLSAIGLSAGGVSVWMYFDNDLSIIGQLLLFAVNNAILIPAAVYLLRRRYSPTGIGYGTTGTGTEEGKTFLTQRRTYDQLICIAVNGDLYAVRDIDQPSVVPAENIPVELVRFDGTTALVRAPRNTP